MRTDCHIQMSKRFVSLIVICMFLEISNKVSKLIKLTEISRNQGNLQQVDYGYGKNYIGPGRSPGQAVWSGRYTDLKRFL